MPFALDSFTRLGFSSAWLWGVLLLSLRLGAVFLMTPIFAYSGVPMRVRAMLVLGLSVALMPMAGAPLPTRLLDHPGLLVQACFTEWALGSTLAAAILVAFAAFSTAGRLLDLQIGFGMGQVLDPGTNARMPLVATAYSQVAVLVFFLVNGHHALLRGLAYSLERFPLGQPWPLDAALEPILRQAAGLFGMAFLLAAPVVFCILLVEMVLGAIARSMPQINMLTLGIPLKILVGLATLSLWFAGIGPVMSRVYSSIYRAWDGVMAGGHP
ncbi:flagellar biosynthetic protein FliR [Holophaga foetida]|uniref:flagellar biosynthetic protein FliR n=1 Tax=Holophaga foetida TaxID=35839 RepID=UPI0002474642|nr:flagellar biosynthetic protein FliR [Holophaga foetida]